MTTPIQFDADSHTYTRNQKEYISVTTLLKKFGLSADYANISETVLKKAAEKGNAIHKALELYINGDKSMIDLVDEVKLFDNYVNLKNLDINTMTSEMIVFDDNSKTAGTVDLQYSNEGNDYIADFKTTSTLHIDVVAWQLSIYAYILAKGDMLKYYLYKLQAIHFYGGRMYVKNIYTIDYEQVEALLEANLKGETEFNYVKPNKIISKSQETLVMQLLNEIEQNKETGTALKEELDKVLDVVKDTMEKEKEYSYSTDNIRIIYNPHIVTRSLNQKKVKEYLENAGENLEDFYTIIQQAPRITAKIPKPKDED